MTGYRDKLFILCTMATVFYLCFECDTMKAAGSSRAREVYAFKTEQNLQDRIMFRRESYNYAPALLIENNIYHMYWCGGIAGDFILHSESASIEGPWHSTTTSSPNSFDIALSPTKSAADFDGLHTCDPNVIKVGSAFFLYYSGEAKEGALTAVGVATSVDAVHFSRQNSRLPIVTASATNANYLKLPALSYGAGQPAATFVNPYIYLSFTDSTASGANLRNGAGQFALRSSDPLFRKGVQELTATGWKARQAGHHTGEFSFLESFGLDWGYDERTGVIIAISDRVANKASIFFLDPERLLTRGTADINLAWREGPALLTNADKSIVSRPSCEKLTLMVLAAEGASGSPWTWNSLGYSSAALSIGQLCG